MRLRHLGVVGALTSSLPLSGCAGAIMAIGPAAFPAALMVAAPMDEMGMFDGMPGAATNPALRNHPVLGDADLSAQQAQLIRRHAAFSADVDGKFSAANALDCSLNEQTLWLFVHSNNKRDFEEAMASLPPEIQPRYLSRQAALLEGDCVAGRPEGAFVAVARHESVQGSGVLESWSNDRRRLSGTMRDGALVGQLHLDTVSMSESSSLGRLSHSHAFGILEYHEGLPSGRSLHLTFSYDETGELTQVLTQVHEFPAPGVMVVTAYAGATRFQEYTIRDGQMHGWMVMHPVEFVEGYASDGFRTCYRFGQEAPDSACSAMAS